MASLTHIIHCISCFYVHNYACLSSRVKARMATGYAPDGSVAPLTDLGWLAPAGQMYSTTNDLNKVSS